MLGIVPEIYEHISVLTKIGLLVHLEHNLLIFIMAGNVFKFKL
jgi:hypothetical protein